jgi:hypothetical protein
MPIGHACVVSAQRESNPLLRTGKPACSLEHLGRVGAPGRTRTGIRRFCKPPPIPSVHRSAEETRGVEPPGPWSTRLANRRAKPACASSPDHIEESGGIEPLTRRSRWFSGPVPHHEARSPIRALLRAAEGLNLAGRFWRPARSQIATLCLSGRIRTCVDLLPRQVGNHYPTPRYWVTGRFRSGTAAFTARHAEPLHHGHHVG